ncbi:hypothetical protein J6590_016073 [Homalodisca vitripennis]|nr:hypothetical protein J6590_016073 [Homalodisca vitripennis]
MMNSKRPCVPYYFHSLDHVQLRRPPGYYRVEELVDYSPDEERSSGDFYVYPAELARSFLVVRNPNWYVSAGSCPVLTCEELSLSSIIMSNLEPFEKVVNQSETSIQRTLFETQLQQEVDLAGLKPLFVGFLRKLKFIPLDYPYDVAISPG